MPDRSARTVSTLFNSKANVKSVVAARLIEVL